MGKTTDVSQTQASTSTQIESPPQSSHAENDNDLDGVVIGARPKKAEPATPRRTGAVTRPGS